jgi:hypothetical protein
MGACMPYRTYIKTTTEVLAWGHPSHGGREVTRWALLEPDDDRSSIGCSSTRAFRTRPFHRTRTRTQTEVTRTQTEVRNSDSDSDWSPKFGLGLRLKSEIRTRTQTEVRNSDSDSDSVSDLRNCDFPTPWPKIISQWNTYDVLTIVDICACGL